MFWSKNPQFLERLKASFNISNGRCLMYLFYCVLVTKVGLHTSLTLLLFPLLLPSQQGFHFEILPKIRFCLFFFFFSWKLRQLWSFFASFPMWNPSWEGCILSPEVLAGAVHLDVEADAFCSYEMCYMSHTAPVWVCFHCGPGKRRWGNVRWLWAAWGLLARPQRFSLLGWWRQLLEGDDCRWKQGCSASVEEPKRMRGCASHGPGQQATGEHE